MAYTRTGMMESRPLDSIYDTTFTGPYTSSFTDKRVLSKLSSQNMVAGTTRFKYFRRPVMPQLTAATPQVLLAPTNEDPLLPAEEAPEPDVKTVEVQTMYRESEAQTIPYTPTYIIPDGQDPEILLLKDLTYEHGLPLGKKEFDMVEHARLKRNLEMNIPPFTDEASLNLRKHLMELQELKEFRFRENEIDAKREERLGQLRQVLIDRDESNEFLSAQRVEAVRQLRMEEREKVLEKIRSKRIKVLRRLANERNKVDPILHDTTSRTIIDDHFDKSSALYAPKRRDGNEYYINHEKFNVLSRTSPFEDMNHITDFESSIPRKLLTADDNSVFSPLKAKELVSNTAPMILLNGGGSYGNSNNNSNNNINTITNHLIEERLTSAARRDLKNTKRDVEEMHRIIQQKKRAFHSQSATQAVNAATEALKLTQSLPTDQPTTSSGVGGGGGSIPTTANAVETGMSKLVTISRRAKGRPPTPDITVDEKGEPRKSTRELEAAVILLQSVIRGRAVQNIMIEGRYRRKELIAELRQADEYLKEQEANEVVDKINRLRIDRDTRLKSSTEDAIIGSVTSNLAYQLATETNRQDTLKQMQSIADEAVEERRRLEAAEAGRRQREGLEYPNSNNGSNGNYIDTSNNNTEI